MTAAEPLLALIQSGLYCAAGRFHIDPWPEADTPVAQAVITHGHADHARGGVDHYFATAPTAAVLRRRLSDTLQITELGYGAVRRFGEVEVSLHPAGHILGSAQVRVAHGGEVWVVTGDFKRDADPSCAPFEPVVCDTLVTEATFALPIYHWRPGREVAADVHAWWQGNAAAGRTSVLFCYALGKAQRILAELIAFGTQTVYLHGAMVSLVELYREHGIGMMPTCALNDAPNDVDLSRQLVLAPPSAAGSPWMRRFKRHATGFVSGWMAVRGNRRRRGYDRGFVMSDHADWPAILRTVEQSGAARVLATHGRTDVLVRYLRERGIAADALRTPYGDEADA